MIYVKVAIDEWRTNVETNKFVYCAIIPYWSETELRKNGTFKI